MTRTERLLATTELQSLLSEYWHDVDTNWGRTAPEYYTGDGIFEGPAATYQGREKIRAFHEWRVQRGKRLAVPPVSTFRANFADERHATGTRCIRHDAAAAEPVQ